jgi:signal transduction histidine kinase
VPDDDRSDKSSGSRDVQLFSEDLFDLVPSAISIMDRNFRLRKTNQTFRQLFGSRIGHYCYGVYKGRTETCRDCPMGKTFADGHVHQSEEVVRTIDGRMIQMAVQTAPLRDDNGEIIGGMEVATDISRTLAAQQELVLLGQAMAGMAHYIKNVVTGLEGGVFVLEEGIESGNDDLLKSGWEMVRRNIRRVTKLSRDQLYCSRERPVEKREVDPNSLVCEAVGLYRDLADRHGIELHVELDQRLEPVYLDPEGFHNLLTNLLSNALDACVYDTGKERHWISVKTFRGSQNEFVVEVAENGLGIPKEMCGDVFTEMFTTKGPLGTGLGLLVVHRVVCAHGGQISVLSDKGVGTVFTVIFPLPEKELIETI